MEDYLLACGSALVLAVLLNLRHPRMLLLTLAVGAGFFAPAPNDSAEKFYLFCTLVQILVATTAWKLDHSAGGWVAQISALLILADLMGYALDGSGAFSPYRVIVKILEFSQIAVCVVLSPVIAPILRNHDATPT